MDEHERKKLQEELRRLLVDIDALEKRWRELPEGVKAANPELAEWFSGKAPTKH